MKKNLAIFRTIFLPFCLVLLIWCVWGIEWASEADYSSMGIMPRRINGLTGILTMPLVHGNLHHLIDNSFPLFLLSWAVFYFYREVALNVLTLSWILGGCWVWLGARTGVWHIGASGLIYSLASFLFFSGVFRRYPRLMAISLLVVFLYGSLIWGIFPYDQSISWEGHLFGAITGVVLAFYYRNHGPAGEQVPFLDEDEADDPEAYWNKPDSENQS
jgi:membrane associated rhomboid family serine protease